MSGAINPPGSSSPNFSTPAVDSPSLRDAPGPSTKKTISDNPASSQVNESAHVTNENTLAKDVSPTDKNRIAYQSI